MQVRWKILVAAVLLVAALPLFARGNKEPPVVAEYPTEAQYLSPNGDNVQEAAKLDFKVTLRVKSKEGYVPTYGLRVKQGDAIVRDVQSATEKSDIGWFMRLFTGYTEFTLERSLEWDGKDDTGKVVSDGTYQGTVYVIDASNNQTEMGVGSFVVDNTAPQATASAESLFFSPNSDGHKDALLIRQGGSSEDLWTGTVVDAAGKTVRTFTWKSSSPVDQAWDGRTDAGAAAPDGSYNYVLEGADRAGNKARIDSLKNIVLDTKPTPVRIAVDPAYFSPNADNVQDTVTFRLTTDIKDGIVGWRLAVTDAARRQVWTREAQASSTPDSVVFDGRDQAGKVLPDGTYTVAYSVSYRNGNVPDTSGSFTLDNTAPTATLEIDNPIFSPAGRKPAATIKVSPSERVTGQGRFLDANGRVLAQSAPGQTVTELQWNGTDPAGNPVPDGTYGIDVTITDLAGNSTRVPPAKITLDTVPPKVNVARGQHDLLPERRRRARHGHGDREHQRARVRQPHGRRPVGCAHRADRPHALWRRRQAGVGRDRAFGPGAPRRHLPGDGQPRGRRGQPGQRRACRGHPRPPRGPDRPRRSRRLRAQRQRGAGPASDQGQRRSL